MGTTGIVIVVIAAVIVVVIGAILVMRRRPKSDPTSAPTPPTFAPAEVAPMSGLETALAQVTDRAGRPIRDAIDAETSHVDDLRVPDDTGPLLRRALDHVTPHDVAPADDALPGGEAGAETDTGSETDTGHDS